jgi:DNA-binding response OmpR family regulator
MPRDEAGDDGLGDDPVGDADARVGGLHQRGLLQVDLSGGEHLVGQIPAAGRVGEVHEPVAAKAARERHHRGGLPLTVGRSLALAPVRQQVTAGRHRRLDGGCLPAGRELSLTRKELGVLEVLLAADGAVVSAEELLERVWDENADPFTRTVAVTLGRLRRKLGEPDLIETVVGTGYRMR